MAIVRTRVKSPRFPERKETGMEFVPESSVKVNSVEENPRTLITEIKSSPLSKIILNCPLYRSCGGYRPALVNNALAYTIFF